MNKDRELQWRLELEAIDRACAFWLFKKALRVAGVPLEEMHAVETDYGDRLVKVTLESGEEYTANISGDSIPTAMWDTLKQIPALRERG